MSKQTEALKLALEAMKDLRMLGMNAQWHDSWLAKPNEAIAAIREALAEQPAQQEPVAWRDHVEQRLLTWRQSFVNKSGDQLALDDFMDKRSLDDMIDFVCSEYTSPPASKPWTGLTDEEIEDAWPFVWRKHESVRHFAIYHAIEAKLREKNA